MMDQRFEFRTLNPMSSSRHRINPSYTFYLGSDQWL